MKNDFDSLCGIIDKIDKLLKDLNEEAQAIVRKAEIRENDDNYEETGQDVL